MDTIKPPTDNLYKFIAVCGLIVFVSGIYLFAGAMNQHMESHLHMYDMAVAELQIEDSNRVPDGETEDDSSNDSDRRQYSWDWLELEAKHDVVVSRIARQGFFAIALIGIGPILAGFGLRRWYEKVQRFEDRRIELEVSVLEEKITEVKKGASESIADETASEQKETVESEGHRTQSG